jgi:vancomycin resistance protein VanJ
MTDADSPRRFTTLRRLLAILIFAYGLVIVGYLALRALDALGLPLSDDSGGVFGALVGMGNSLMPGLLFPSLPLVLLAALLRRPWLALLLAPAGLAFVLLYGDLLLPPSAPAAEPALTVYTHNLHAMTSGLEGVAEAIRASGADVVALQELTEPAADYFAAALGADYPHQALEPRGLTTSGTGILSRWPLDEAEIWMSTMLQMRVTVTAPDGPFAFYSAHPPPPHWFLQAFNTSARTAALDSILERAAQESLPVVLAGDFNLTDQTAAYQRILNAGFRDSFRESGWGLGLTFADLSVYFAPLGLLPPFIRIDYVYHSGDFTAVSARVGPSAGSDHYPVQAALARVRDDAP